MGLSTTLDQRLESSGTYPTWVLRVALAGMFATTFPVTLLTVSLGDIADDLGSNETTLAWVVSGPMLGSAVALPILGKFGDLYGQRRIFLVGFVAAAATSACAATAWNALSLIALRTASQVIGAATMPTALALIAHAFEPGERVKALGWWQLVGAGAPSVGVVVGGPLVDALGWRLLFVLQSLLALAAATVAAIVLRETRHRGPVRFDLAGALTLGVGVGSLMLAVHQGPEWGWSSPAVVVGLAVVCPLALVAFVVRERSAAAPLLPLAMFRRRNFSLPLLNEMLSGATYMGGFVLTPLLLRFVFGYSLSETAFLSLLRPVTFSLCSPLGARLAVRRGERVTGVGGGILMAGGMALFVVGGLERSIGVVCVANVCQGAANGLMRPPMLALLTEEAGEGSFGIAAATSRMVSQVGAALGITLLTTLYGGTRQPSSFARAYLGGLVLALVALVACAFVRSNPRRAGHAPGPAGFASEAEEVHP